jgi:hypothetical protein
MRTSYPSGRYGAVPEEQRPELQNLLERASRFRSECGCSSGAVFMLISLGMVFAYVAVKPEAGLLDRAVQVLLGLVTVLVASIVGKTAGIGIARFRLALLTRHIATRFPIHGVL